MIAAFKFIQPSINEVSRIVVVWIEKAREHSRGRASLPFIIDDALHRRLQARFEKELSLWGADSNSHLMAIATFGLNPAGLAIVDEIALMVVSENYPQLRSQENFATLMDQLEGTENQINVARMRYNEAVQSYNTTIRTFPDMIGAKLIHGAKPMVAFKADPGASAAPTVDFGGQQPAPASN